MLGKFLFDLVSEKCLAQLAGKTLLAGQEIIARELLRQRTGSARNFECADHFEAGPNDALVVDSRMLEKPSVFRGDKRADDVRRQFLESNDNPASLAKFGNQAAVAAENPQRDL